jgi:hypothetical protein
MSPGREEERMRGRTEGGGRDRKEDGGRRVEVGLEGGEGGGQRDATNIFQAERRSWTTFALGGSTMSPGST